VNVRNLKPVLIKLDRSVWERLRRIAVAQDRSASGIVRQILDAGLPAWEAENQSCKLA